MPTINELEERPQEEIASHHSTQSKNPSSRQNRIERLRVRLRPLTLATFASALVLDVLNSTGVIFALPDFVTKYNIKENEATWALSAYALTFGAFMLTTGRLGDIIGHKKIFVLGLALFALFSALIAAIENVIAIFIFRAFQGITAAMTVPTAYALVSTSYSGRAREMALSILGMGIAFGVAIGMIIGGAVTLASQGYQLLFWASFGLSALFCMLSMVLIPPSPAHSRDWRDLDFTGAFLAVAGMLLIVLGLTEAPGRWDQALALAPLICGVATLAILICWEEYGLPKFKSGGAAVLPKRIWSYRDFKAVLVVTGLMYGTCYLVMLSGAQYLVDVQERTPIVAAVQFVPYAVSPFIAMPIFGLLHSKVSPKWVVIGGQVFTIVGEVLFILNKPDSFYWHYTFPSTILVSVGMAAFFVNFINIAVAGAPLEDQGLISGVLQSVAQAAVAFAFAISGSFLTGTTEESLEQGYDNTFYCALGMAGAACIITIIFLKDTPRKIVSEGGGAEVV